MPNTRGGSTPEETFEQRERNRVYELALHDIRRAIETLRADDALMAWVYRRIILAFHEAHGQLPRR